MSLAFKMPHWQSHVRQMGITVITDGPVSSSHLREPWGFRWLV